MAFLLGIDIGTSGAKAIVIDGRGRIVSSATAEYPLSRPHEGWSEQDPEDWWKGVCRAIRAAMSRGRRRVRADEIPALGLSGQMHGSVLLGRDAATSGGRAKALRRAILWNDQRTAAQCAEIESAVGGRARLVELVGNAAMTGFTLPKLLWVREHEPSLWKRVQSVVLPKDFVCLRLTGELGTDVGDAGGTLLFNVDRREWNREVFEAIGIDPAVLPRAVESSAVAGRVTKWAADQTGLCEGTPVVAGSGDNQAGAVGAGVVEPGMAMAMLGTSGVILAHSDRPRKDLADPDHPGRLHTMCAATGPDGWCITGVMLSAAGSLAWCRETIAPGIKFETLLREAAKAPPGCDGLIFLPYLTGERCPHADPHARGAWIGLTSRHTRAHLVRAVIEGVTFGMGQILDLVRGLGVQVSSVRLSGGGNRSPLWRQIQADVYGCTVSTTNTEEGGSAFGAAIMAGVGAGIWPGAAAACRETVKLKETVRPSRKAAAKYARAKATYDRLYDDLKSRFAEMAG